MADAEGVVKKDQLDPEIKKAVLFLFREIPKEENRERRNLVKSIAKKRGFYKGDPVGWYDPETAAWLPADTAPEANADNAPQYCYVINIYQAVVLILLSSIASSGIPGNRFVPQNPRDIADVQTAKQAQAIIEYQRQQIDFLMLWWEIFRLYAIDGFVLAYTRHVRDGQEFGYTPVTVQKQGERQAAPEGIDCPECQKRVGLDEAQKGDMGGMYCPDCGNSLEGSPLQPPKLAPTLETQVVQEPNGQEMVELFGGLETRRPYWAKTLKQHPWIGIDIEASRDSIASAFPDYAEEIQQDSSKEEEANDRSARLGSMTPQPPQGLGWTPTVASGASNTHLATYSRYWFRPSTYWRIKKKEVRELLFKEYKDGIFAQFCGETLLNCINESMDEHLDLSYGLTGDGANPPALCDNMVPVQEGLNSAYNLALEALEYCSFPPIVVDGSMISTTELQHRKMRPADLLEIKVPAGKNIEQAFFQPQIKDTSVAIQNVITEAFKWAEYLSGAGGALTGGGIQNNRTAQAYVTARNQAMGRLAIPFQSGKSLLARIEEKLVHEFSTKHTRDEVFAVVGKGSKGWEERVINLTTARGKVRAYAEDSETIPTTWAQKQAIWQQLISSNNPVIQALLADPNNTELWSQALAVPEISIPGKEQRNRMYERIEQLLAAGAPQPGQPVQPPPQNINGQVIQMPAQPGPPTPTIPFRQVTDNPAICLAVIQEWASTEEGQNAEGTNPNGFANVLAYGAQCMQALAAAQAQQQPQPRQRAKSPQAPPPGEGHERSAERVQ